MSRRYSQSAKDCDLVDALCAAYPRVVRIYDQEVKAGRFGLASRVATELAVRIQRQAEAIRAVGAAGLDDESLGMVRVPAELLVTQMFIIHAGPASGKGTPDELSQRFLDFADHQRLRMFENEPKAVIEALESKGRSETEIADRRAELERSRAASTHGFGVRWHPLALPDMAAMVEKHVPPFITNKGVGAVFEMIKPIIRYCHTRLHADSLAHSPFYRVGEGVFKFEDLRSVDYRWAETAGILAYVGHLVAAQQIGVLDAVFEMIDHHAMAAR